MNSSWLTNASANRLKQSYVQGFVDLSGNAIIRNGSVNIKNGKLFLPQGDISMNGNIICSGSISLGASAGSGYQMTVNGNTHVKKSLLVDNDASVMSSLGVGKVANDTYPLDVSGASRFSSNITVGGAATLGSITNVAGTSSFTGSVGIGVDADPTYALLVIGQSRATGQTILDKSIAIGPDIDYEAEVQNATVYVKAPLSSNAPNDVVMNVPNNLYVSTDSTNQSKTNKLEIDTKNHVIKPYIEVDGSALTDVANGWDLGATGANSFNRVYGRSLEVSKNMGVGKSSDAGYAIDVSGATRLSSSLAVGGAATIGSITNVTGTSKFTGEVGIGKTADATIALDVSGTTIVSGNAFVTKSLVVGNTTPSTATFHINAPTSTATNTVIIEAPNVLYKAASSSNPANTNFLEIDAKTQTILPYAMTGSTTLNTAATSWNLGGPGANQLNSVYSRKLNMPTDAIKVEDLSGNKVNVVFDATTGSVSYNVTKSSGEVFTIKGVQTQQNGSGPNKIDPALLEFTGLSFGDTFSVSDAYNLATTFTYNLATTTYTGDGTTFSTSAGAQSLDSFVTGTNLTTLLALIPIGTSVVINVGATDGRSSNLEGIDVAGSLVSLASKIISVKKTNSATTWILWNSDGYQNVAGNFLHYIELKNINMTSGTYFIPKADGTMTYNISDTQYMETADLTAANGDIYLYVNRGPGKNWTKVRVALPQAGTIQSQHMADSAITTSKLANESVTGAKIADGSISGLKITDNSIISSKIADSNVTTAKILDGAVTGAKLAGGAIDNDNLIADGIITGAKLASGAIVEAAIGAESVTETKIGGGAVTTTKLADNSVTVDKLANGSITSSKMTADAILNQHIAGGAVTNNKISDYSITEDKIANGAVTAAKLAAGVITGGLLDASSVTMAKIASGAVSTDKIASLAVTSAKIANSAITDAKLADGSVTSAKLAADSVSETNISENAITSAKIANYAVTADKIAGSAITSGKIADGSILESKLGESVITTDKLANMSVTSEKLADFAVTEYKIRDGSITMAKLASSALTAGPTGPAGADGIAGPTGAVGPTGPAGGASSFSNTSNIVANSITASSSTTGIPDTVITGSVASGKFGQGAVVSRNGNVMISVNNNSTLFVYRKNTSTLLWALETSINTSATSFIYPAISGDGNTIIVSNGTNSTRRYTYTTTWSSAVTLTTAQPLAFGRYILINNDASLVFFINAPSGTTVPPCRVYKTSDTSITNLGFAGSSSINPQIESGYHYSACISDDGTTLVISNNDTTFVNGVYSSSRGGAIMIATFVSNAWTTTHILGTTLYASGLLGRNVSVSGDGKIIMVSCGFQDGYNSFAAALQYKLNGTYWRGHQIIYMYALNEITGLWSKQSEITKNYNQFSGNWGSKLALNTAGDTLAVGTWSNSYNNNGALNTPLGANKYRSIIYGYMIYVHIYKRVGINWSLYTTYTTDIYRENLTLVTSRYGASISMDSTGNTIVVSEDDYYLKANDSTNNSVGRVHIYNTVNARTLDITGGGGSVKDNLMIGRDLIANGSCTSNKLYTGTCSVLDTLTVGGPPLYGLNDRDDSSMYSVDSYSLWVTTPLGGAIAHSGLANYNGQSNCRVRFDGQLEIYGGFGSAGNNATGYTAAGTVITLDAIDGWVLANDALLNRTLNVSGAITAGGRIYTSNLLAENSTINNPNIAGTIRIANTISRDTNIPILSKRYNGAFHNVYPSKFKFDLGGAYCNPVCVSSNGNVMLSSTISSPSGGALYICRRDLNTLQWGNPTIINTSGLYLSLSGDGNVIASSDGTTIIIRRWSGTTWTLQSGTITNSSYTSNFVKTDMNLNSDGSKILVSSFTSNSNLKLFIYDTVSRAILITIDLASQGYAVADSYSPNFWNMPSRAGADGTRSWTFRSKFSLDGSTVITSCATSGSNAGKVLVYDINYGSSTATLNTTFTGAITGDYFGKRISVNSSGSVIAFSAGFFNSYNNSTSKARVLIYKRSVGGSEWTLDKTFIDTDVPGLSTPGFGAQVCLDDVGNTILITSSNETGYMRQPNPGTPNVVSISRYVNGSWSSFTNITESLPYNTYGESLAINSNGSTIVVDAMRDLSIQDGPNALNAPPYGGSIFIYETYSDKSMELKSSNSIVLSTGSTSTSRLTINEIGEIGIGTNPVGGTTLSISGNVTATGSITGSSDDRLKDNEQLIIDATSTLMKLRPEIYDKKPTFDSSDNSAWQKESGLIAQDVWYGAPELRHLVKPGQYVCDYKKELQPLPTLNLTRYLDASGIEITGPLEQIDVSGNTVTDPSGIQIVIDSIPRSTTIDIPIYKEIDPANIIDIPLQSDANIQQDPDYKALGWGDTPASVNYIGLIPYLVKSIQELKTEINEQRSDIEQQKIYIQTLETRLNQ